jgi:hypothetical protein
MKEYSASDGGFLTYRGRVIAKDWKIFLELRLCQSDHIIFPIGKHDQYTEIKTLPVTLDSTKGGFEIGGVRYRKKKLDETTLRSLESLLKTESLEKPKAGL